MSSLTGARIDEVVVNHHPRTMGESKYGLDRIWKVALDIVTIKMITGFATRPSVWFALLSLPVAIVGVLTMVARATGARIVVPSGAVMGLDAVRGAAESGIESVTMITRKPPGGLAGAPYLVANRIDVDGLEAPLKVFEGSAREAARGFPANVNVAAALGLAGIGPGRTRLEIWADPGVTRNTHEIRLEADTVRFQLRIENVPSHENPRTGRSVAPSVVATLRRFVAPLVVGT